MCNTTGIFDTFVNANAAKDVVADSNAPHRRMGRGLAAAGATCRSPTVEVDCHHSAIVRIGTSRPLELQENSFAASIANL
jgi:hypothetical protein